METAHFKPMHIQRIHNPISHVGIAYSVSILHILEGYHLTPVHQQRREGDNVLTQLVGNLPAKWTQQGRRTRSSTYLRGVRWLYYTALAHHPERLDAAAKGRSSSPLFFSEATSYYIQELCD
jgi:hypothetical protein